MEVCRTARILKKQIEMMEDLLNMVAANQVAVNLTA